jgi:hypothetical protein
VYITLIIRSTYRTLIANTFIYKHRDDCMGKLTKEKITAIVNRYNELLSYTEVGKEFGVNWITVKRHVEADRERKAAKGLNTDSAEVQNTATVKKEKSKFAQAVQLFKNGTQLPDVVVELDLSYEEAMKYWEDYCRIAWADHAPRFFALEIDVQLNLMLLQDCMKREGMDPKSYVSRLKKVFNSLDEGTRKANQLSMKSEELTKAVNLEVQRLKSIKYEAGIEQNRVQKLRFENQECLRMIENNKAEAEKTGKVLAGLTGEKQKAHSELAVIKNEINDLLDPNGRSAARSWAQAEDMLAKILADGMTMQEVSLTAMIEAIRRNELSKDVIIALTSSEPIDAPNLIRELSPYLQPVYQRQRKILLDRMIGSIIGEQYAQIAQTASAAH